MEIVDTFIEAMRTTKPNILAYSGRNAGKTKNLVEIFILLFLSNPNHDAVIARASYGSLEDSIIAEVNEVLRENEWDNLFTLQKNPFKLVRKDGGGTIYFQGLGGSENRTKGFKSEFPLIAVLIEETQELPAQKFLDSALSSYRRRMDKTGKGKIFILGNPPAMKAHWFNIFVENKKNDNDYLTIYSTWEDIADYLSDNDIKAILTTKKENPEFYQYMYLGEPTGEFGMVYPMFRPQKQVLKEIDVKLQMDAMNARILCVVIGVDGAVNRDATSFVPELVLSNGQVVVADIFYHDPRVDKAMGYHELVQNYVRTWLNDLIKKWNLGSVETPSRVPIFIRCDSAAADLIKELQFFLSARCNVSKIKKSTIMEMVSVTQNAIGNDRIIICDNGGYFDYYQKKFIKTENLLSRQLKALVWNEKQDKYDPSVPNDVSDAFTYANYFWFKNVEHLYWITSFEDSLPQNTNKIGIIKGESV